MRSRVHDRAPVDPAAPLNMTSPLPAPWCRPMTHALVYANMKG